MLLCWRYRDEATVAEKENLGVQGRTWGQGAAAATSYWALLTTPSFVEPDLYFRRTTLATVWRKRASVAIGCYARERGWWLGPGLGQWK